MRNWIFIFTLALFVNCPLFALEKDIEFTNTLDKSKQKAAVFVPDAYDGKKPLPLLVIAHYMGGNRYMAKQVGYYKECNKRGWLLVCPELHGQKSTGPFSLAAPNAQYDILDAIEYMKKNYKVDESRIYIAGRSMGGMMSALMAAKHPDIFAGAVAGQGLYDLKSFIKNALPNLLEASYKEMEPLSPQTEFDYARRSALNYAKNLRYVPLVLWHGTNDTWVKPEQSERLFKAVKKHKPHQAEVNWLDGACHCATNYTPEWICKKLEYFQNKPEVAYGIKTRFFPELSFVTDEDQSFFWVSVKTADKKSFCNVDAAILKDVCHITCSKVKELTVDLDKIAKIIKLKSVTLKSETDVTLKVLENGKVLSEASGKNIDLEIVKPKVSK